MAGAALRRSEIRRLANQLPAALAEARPVSQCVLPDGALAVLPIAKCPDIGLPESSLEPLPDN